MKEMNDNDASVWASRSEQAYKTLRGITPAELAIGQQAKDEVWRQDMVRLYRYRPLVDKPRGQPLLIVYAQIGRYEMIDLEPGRSMVEKLLLAGLDVYVIDWGLPSRAHRHMTMEDYVCGYLDTAVELIAAAARTADIDLLGICQGGVFSVCYSALFPRKVRKLILTVTPLDFHADKANPRSGFGYINQWVRSIQASEIDTIVDAYGTIPGELVGQAFLMMNPIGNAVKYSHEWVALADDRDRLLNFLRMERWIADRPNQPGEVLRQWLKDFYLDNKLVSGRVKLGAYAVDMASLKMPILNIFAAEDTIVPPECSRGFGKYIASRDYSEIELPGGHIGVFVGSRSQKMLAPAIAKWLDGGLPVKRVR
jgi:polyhydroxyalkanoate synthase